MKRTRFTSQRTMALACLFLSRTSFNGALHPRAEPIGGTSGKDFLRPLLSIAVMFGFSCISFPLTRLAIFLERRLV